MSSPKSILVPTDYSRCSDAALAWAALFARTVGATVRLVHVVDERDDVQVLGPGTSGHAALRQQLVEQARRADAGPVQISIRSGDPCREILEEAKETRADLVIMGTRGRNGISRLMLGSTAEKVVRLANVPVMTVHEPPRSTTEDAALKAV